MKLFLLALLLGLGISFISASELMQFDQQLQILSKDIAVKIDAAGKKKVAVVDFSDLQGNITELGRYISEEMSISMVENAKGFTMVDRNHLKTIMKELKLGLTGVLDATTTKEIGKITGVDALITGSITPLGDVIKLSVKVLDTQTADIIAAGRIELPKTKSIEALLTSNIGDAPNKTDSKNNSSAPYNDKVFYDGVVEFSNFSVKKVGDVVTIECLIKNLSEKEIEYKIMQQAFVTDTNFTTQNIYYIKFGTDEGDRPDNPYFGVSQNLYPRVPVKWVIKVTGLTTSISSIKLFRPGSGLHDKEVFLNFNK